MYKALVSALLILQFGDPYLRARVCAFVSGCKEDAPIISETSICKRTRKADTNHTLIS